MTQEQPTEILIPNYGLVIPRDDFLGAVSTVTQRHFWKLLVPENADSPWKIQKQSELLLRFYVRIGIPQDDDGSAAVPEIKSRWDLLWKNGEFELARELITQPAGPEEILTESREFLMRLDDQKRAYLHRELQFLSNHMRVKSRYEQEAITFSQRQEEARQAGNEFSDNPPVAPRDEDFKVRLANLSQNVQSLKIVGEEQLTPAFLMALGDNNEVKNVTDTIATYSELHLKPLMNGSL